MVRAYAVAALVVKLSARPCPSMALLLLVPRMGIGLVERLRKGVAAAAALLACAGVAQAAPRVFSLDQCADQYVLALTPRSDIVGLSFRADDADSYLRAAAARLPLRRASTESVLASRADVVVRYWGGDELMTRRLQERGLKVIKIEDASDFTGVRANVRHVAAALGRPAEGEALVAGMDRELAAARGAWSGQRVLYLTPGGFTAGPDTLVGAMIAGAGLTDAAGPGFAPVPLERMAIDPPAALVLGFFDPVSLGTQRWSIGRRAIVRRIAAQRTLASLPASILGCPAWFAADGPRDLAAARKGGP